MHSPFFLGTLFLASYLSFLFILPQTLFENHNIHNAESRTSHKWLWVGNLHTFLPKCYQGAASPLKSVNSSILMSAFGAAVFCQFIFLQQRRSLLSAEVLLFFNEVLHFEVSMVPVFSRFNVKDKGKLCQAFCVCLRMNFHLQIMQCYAKTSHNPLSVCTSDSLKCEYFLWSRYSSTHFCFFMHEHNICPVL